MTRISSINDFSNFTGVYCFGFQRQEQDEELWERAVTFKYRVEDARLGRFFSVDPLLYRFPDLSVYSFSANRTIDAIEMLGLQPRTATRRANTRTSRNFSGTSFFSRIFGIDYQGKYMRNNVRLGQNASQMANTNPPEPNTSEVFLPIIPLPGSLPVQTDRGLKKSVPMLHVPEPTKEVVKDTEDSHEPENESTPSRPRLPVPNLDIRFTGNDNEFINRDEARKQVAQLAQYLKENPNINITVIGNTGGDPSVQEGHSSTTMNSSVPSNKFPTIRDLMIGRARAVRQLLIQEYQIDPKRIWVAPGNHSHKESARKTTVIERK